MISSIFYKGEALFNERKINIQTIFPSLEDEVEILAYDFFKSKELLTLVFLDNTPRLVCKPAPLHEAQLNEFEQHTNLIRTLGEIIEILNSLEFENIFVLFASNEKADIAKSFAFQDFHKKILDSPHHTNSYSKIDPTSLVFLGEEADGNKIFYNKEGKIFIYSTDPSIDGGLKPIDGMPKDTFYLDRKFNSFSHIAASIFRKAT